MRMRRPDWLTVATVLIGVAAVSLVSVRPHDVSHAAARPGAVPAPPTTSAPAVVTPPTATCASVVATLPQRAKLGQLFMVGIAPAQARTAVSLARDTQVGGLFIGSGDTNLLTDGAIAKARAAARLPLFVGIDEEGGRVQRVTGPHGRLPSARTMAATMSPTQVRALATSLGDELRGLGVNMDLAPDADVSDQPADAVIGDRSFSDTASVVTTYAGAFAAGLRVAGVLPVLKHFPGHGHAVGDSHTGSAVTPPLSSLLRDDLVPYRRLPSAGVTAVMVGHLQVPGLTGTVPSSLSPAAYRLLRTTFGFNGIAITDDLGAMTAVTAHYTLPDAVLLAIRAGADIALWTTGGQLGQVEDRLTAAVASGELPAARVNQAVTRVLAAKGVCTA